MLLLDIGNSALKAGYVRNGEIVDIRRHRSVKKDIKKVIKKINFNEKVLVCNSNRHISSDYLQKLNPNLKVVRSAKRFNGLKNGYKDYRQLGADRWLNMIYAWHKVKDSCCVIDCGTCITYDQIDANGQHLGGFILPGQNLNQAALEKLLKIKLDSNSSTALGLDTNSAVSHGSNFLLLNTVKGLINFYIRSNNNNMNIFVTGGSATTLKSEIKSEAFFIDNMVLKGLLHIPAT